MTAGHLPTPRCAAAPSPAPDGLHGLRRLSIQPTDATSCLEWFAVDLWLTADGLLAGVALDLYGP